MATEYTGTVPSRGQSPSTHVSAWDSFLQWMVDVVPELNTDTTNNDSNATAAAASAAAAASSETAAVAAANFKGAWSGLTGALNVPASVSHSGKLWLLLNNLADVTASTPGVSSDWQEIKTGQFSVSVTATSTTATAGQHVYVTAATQTITLPISPTAGDTVAVSVGAFADTVIGRNGSNIMTLSENMTIDSENKTVTFRYIDATRGWVLV